jgi:hypothetical protein
MEVFYLVLVFNSFNKGGIDTIPIPYETEAICQASGKLFTEKVSGDYVCLPAKISNSRYGLLITDASEEK